MRQAEPQSSAALDPVTEDALLGGRVRLRQPASGYRAAIDPVFLAAAVAADAGESVLDMGCGVGAALLCLATRVADCRIVGLDREPDLVRLAVENIALNDLGSRVSAIAGDLLDPPMAPGSFDHVMANPPFLEAAAAMAPIDRGAVTATIEGAADLAAWVRVALDMVRAKGSLTIIHRADRLDTLLALLARRAGEIVVFPLWPGGGKPARRVLVRARKHVATPLRLMPGLVLHQADGRFTAQASAVLRGGEGLVL